MALYKRSIQKIAISIFCVLLACVFLADTSQSNADSLPEPKHLIALRKLLGHISIENNSYQRKHQRVEWEGFNGATKYSCHTDCCGLLDSVLIHSYHYSRRDFKRWVGEYHPRASTYYKAIVNSKGFENISNISKVQPGDIIALCYPPGSKNNGHIMFVNRLPKEITNVPPIIDETKQWAVDIIDCTGSFHGPRDTRHSQDGQHRSGIGEGTFRIYTDMDGNIVGYSWSAEPHSAFHGEDDRKIAVGRIHNQH